MSVREIKRTSLLDVPAKLREIAAEYERRPDELRTAILVVGYRSGHVAVRGYGERTSALEATGWLHRALDVLTDGVGMSDSLTPAPPKGSA